VEFDIKTGKLHKVIYYKRRYSKTTLIFNVVSYHILHTSSNVSPRHKSLGRGCLLLLCQPVTYSLIYFLVRSEATSTYSLLGAKRGENQWVPNMANMADGVTLPIVSTESASRHYGQYEVESLGVADTRQKTTYYGYFL
jgi:hypothetical protein